MNPLNRSAASSVGAAGEHRVVSELLLRGFYPMLAIVDNGIDITLENGYTLQVKTATRARMQGDRPNYSFNFTTSIWSKGRKVSRNRMVADFAVCWCIPHNAFFIIPQRIIGPRRKSICVSIDNVRPSIFDRCRDNWGQLRRPETPETATLR